MRKKRVREEKNDITYVSYEKKYYVKVTFLKCINNEFYYLNTQNLGFFFDRTQNIF